MKLELSVRVTRRRKCREGFYVVINGKRLRYANRALAIKEVRSWLALQRIQIVTVREYAERNRSKIKREMPKARPAHALPSSVAGRRFFARPNESVIENCAGGPT